jgi:hypothetical protein
MMMTAILATRCARSVPEQMVRLNDWLIAESVRAELEDPEGGPKHFSFWDCDICGAEIFAPGNDCGRHRYPKKTA